MVSNEKNNDLGLNHNTNFSNPWFKGKEYHKKTALLLHLFLIFVHVVQHKELKSQRLEK